MCSERGSKQFAGKAESENWCSLTLKEPLTVRFCKNFIMSPESIVSMMIPPRRFSIATSGEYDDRLNTE